MPGPVPPQGEDESEKAMETAALLTAAAAEQWEASLARLKNEINRCDIETKTFLAPILKHPSAQQVLVSFLSDPSKSFQDWIWEPRAHEVLNRFRSSLSQQTSQGTVELFFPPHRRPPPPSSLYLVPHIPPLYLSGCFIVHLFSHALILWRKLSYSVVSVLYPFLSAALAFPPSIPPPLLPSFPPSLL
ncbi:hypothetical protein Naga_100882g3, partial [Nannochloropsis gaditana]